jgi:hypothetical protein
MRDLVLEFSSLVEEKRDYCKVRMWVEASKAANSLIDLHSKDI